MCGIAGLVSRDLSKDLSDSAVRMGRTQSHRGPDAEGLESGPGFAFSHQRLAIIDLQGGAQPMWSADRDSVLTFNGEIYNYPDLRKRLEGAGHQFKTRSDTEVIVHLYEDEGPEVFSHLNGMFAIARTASRFLSIVAFVRATPVTAVPSSSPTLSAPIRSVSSVSQSERPLSALSSFTLDILAPLPRPDFVARNQSAMRGV